jgi:polyphosphate glucokinase
LAVDVGGTHVKILAAEEKQKREIVSGPRMTAQQIVSRVKKIAQGFSYDAVSVGFARTGSPRSSHRRTSQLRAGLDGFRFCVGIRLTREGYQRWAMLALGSYEGGKMLFLGLGTGLGSAMIHL